MIRKTLLALVLLFLGSVLWLAWFAMSPIPMQRPLLEFRVLPGTGMKGIARAIHNAGGGFAPWQFVLLARVTGQTTGIKAGSYEVAAGTTALQLLGKLARGEVAQGEAALIDGWTFAQMRQVIDNHPHLQHDSRGLTDAQLLARIGAPERSAEGLFFPDTYRFDKYASDIEVYRQAYRGMQTRLAAAWEKRAPGLPYTTPYQALIMASIVEKETGRESDRTMVASVFVNRLRIGMRLQTDPTVIYGMGKAFDGNLRKADLLADTPYNTYTRAGLPPTPIALPGRRSLEAALNPAQSKALYFVARGDGSSQFSATLDDHNRAVSRYQRNGK